MSEEMLKKIGLSSQVLFESLLVRLPDKIYFKDSQSRFIIVSDSMVKNFKAESASELIGKTDFDFFSAEHAQQAFEDEQRVIETGIPSIREAEKETWPDGTVTWASSIKAPIVLEEGKPVGIIGISRDVTKEKLAHDALERHDRLLKKQNDTMRADLENARLVQSLLIPGKERRSSFLRIAIAYDPSHGVSGDVVTFPRPDEEDVRFFLGDVCGHGVSAGIYTLLVKYAADRLSRASDDRPQSVLSRMNEGLKDVLPNRFVTAMTGVFQRSDDGSLRLQISHAAHPTFFIHRNSDELETIQLDSAPGLGLLPGSSFASKEFSITRGDRVILFTDGLEEALNENGEEFGIERLEALVRESRNEQPDKVPGFLLAKIQKFAGRAPRVDDQTCVVFQVS
jgi:sigma-B regulation protein RsbU (phosphoserine phosphatase)